MKLRTLSLVGGLLVGCAVCAAQDQNVSYESVAKPVSKIVSELASQSGISLTVDPNSANHVLILSVSEVRLDDVLDRIANACSSKWVEKDGLRTLTPDNQLRNQELQAYRADLLVEAQSIITQAKARLNAPEDEEGGSEMFGLGPMFGAGSRSKGINELVIGLGEREIAGALEAGRVVFSTAPNLNSKAVAESPYKRHLAADRGGTQRLCRKGGAKNPGPARRASK